MWMESSVQCRAGRESVPAHGLTIHASEHLGHGLTPIIQFCLALCESVAH